jgi:hypothetical protein
MSTSTRRAPWNSGLFLESQTIWHLDGAHLCLTALSRRNPSLPGIRALPRLLRLPKVSSYSITFTTKASS